jgi:hypothetical protein
LFIKFGITLRLQPQRHKDAKGIKTKGTKKNKTQRLF